ncbi:MAG: aminotransferase class I/II-fold pyridoxal phosphate-dependent enzyme [Gammaproteobacteria bacterium]|nr:aminotransferase class I/II-fold pyridoxal phosphate-dependent enzyme [Gammaproteobacteria bacterium]
MSYERDSVRRMAGYVYGEQPQDPGIVKLNTNENPYPPSPAVADAIRSFDAGTLRRYPPATADGFRRQVATRFGLSVDQVVATNGGDEALRLAITTFVDPGATFGTTEPGYSLCPVLANVQGCKVASAELTPDWSLPDGFAGRMNAAGAKLTCLVNPHAPSGVLVDADTVAAVARELDGVLLVDEAYVDFVDPELRHDLTSLLADHDNLLLLRTLSKGHSLAGLRVGFLLGNAGLVDPILTKTRDSYNVDSLAQVAAEAAFADRAYAERGWRAVRGERRRLTVGLVELGFAVPGSQSNFVLAEAPPDMPAGALFLRLRERGIVVRHFDTPRLSNSLRFTVGTASETDLLLAAVGEIAPSLRCNS